MSQSIVTAASLTAMLANESIRQHVIGRALVVLFKRQTDAEKEQNTTNVTNNRGFTQADARWGCIMAKYYIKNKTLSPKAVANWMRPNAKGQPRIVKYWRQLNEAAAERAAATAPIALKTETVAPVAPVVVAQVDGAALLANMIGA